MDAYKLSVCLEIAKRRAQELLAHRQLTTPEFSEQYEKSARLYDAVSSVLFTTLSISNIPELERFIEKTSRELPVALFDWKEWLAVLESASRLRNQTTSPIGTTSISEELIVLLRGLVTLPTSCKADIDQLKKLLIPILENEHDQYKKLEIALAHTEARHQLAVERICNLEAEIERISTYPATSQSALGINMDSYSEDHIDSAHQTQHSVDSTSAGELLRDLQSSPETAPRNLVVSELQSSTESGTQNFVVPDLQPSSGSAKLNFLASAPQEKSLTGDGNVNLQGHSTVIVSARESVKNLNALHEESSHLIALQKRLIESESIVMAAEAATRTTSQTVRKLQAEYDSLSLQHTKALSELRILRERVTSDITVEETFQGQLSAYAESLLELKAERDNHIIECSKLESEVKDLKYQMRSSLSSAALQAEQSNRAHMASLQKTHTAYSTLLEQNKSLLRELGDSNMALIEAQAALRARTVEDELEFARARDCLASTVAVLPPSNFVPGTVKEWTVGTTNTMTGEVGTTARIPVQSMSEPETDAVDLDDPDHEVSGNMGRSVAPNRLKKGASVVSKSYDTLPHMLQRDISAILEANTATVSAAATAADATAAARTKKYKVAYKKEKDLSTRLQLELTQAQSMLTKSHSEVTHLQSSLRKALLQSAELTTQKNSMALDLEREVQEGERTVDESTKKLSSLQAQLAAELNTKSRLLQGSGEATVLLEQTELLKRDYQRQQQLNEITIIEWKSKSKKLEERLTAAESTIEELRAAMESKSALLHQSEMKLKECKKSLELSKKDTEVLSEDDFTEMNAALTHVESVASKTAEALVAQIDELEKERAARIEIELELDALTENTHKEWANITQTQASSAALVAVLEREKAARVKAQTALVLLTNEFEEARAVHMKVESALATLTSDFEREKAARLVSEAALTKMTNSLEEMEEGEGKSTVSELKLSEGSYELKISEGSCDRLEESIQSGEATDEQIANLIEQLGSEARDQISSLQDQLKSLQRQVVQLTDKSDKAAMGFSSGAALTKMTNSLEEMEEGEGKSIVSELKLSEGSYELKISEGSCDRLEESIQSGEATDEQIANLIEQLGSEARDQISSLQDQLKSLQAQVVQLTDKSDKAAMEYELAKEASQEVDIDLNKRELEEGKRALMQLKVDHESKLMRVSQDYEAKSTELAEKLRQSNLDFVKSEKEHEAMIQQLKNQQSQQQHSLAPLQSMPTPSSSPSPTESQLKAEVAELRFRATESEDRLRQLTVDSQAALLAAVDEAKAEASMAGEEQMYVLTEELDKAKDSLARALVRVAAQDEQLQQLTSKLSSAQSNANASASEIAKKTDDEAISMVVLADQNQLRVKVTLLEGDIARLSKVEQTLSKSLQEANERVEVKAQAMATLEASIGLLQSELDEAKVVSASSRKSMEGQEAQMSEEKVKAAEEQVCVVTDQFERERMARTKAQHDLLSLTATHVSTSATTSAVLAILSSLPSMPSRPDTPLKSVHSRKLQGTAAEAATASNGADIDKFKHAIESLKFQVSQLELEKSGLTQEIAKFEENETTLSQEITRLRDGELTLSQQITTLTKQVLDKEKERAQLSTDLAAATVLQAADTKTAASVGEERVPEYGTSAVHKAHSVPAIDSLRDEQISNLRSEQEGMAKQLAELMALVQNRTDPSSALIQPVVATSTLAGATATVITPAELTTKTESHSHEAEFIADLKNELAHKSDSLSSAEREIDILRSEIERLEAESRLTVETASSQQMASETAAIKKVGEEVTKKVTEEEERESLVADLHAEKTQRFQLETLLKDERAERLRAEAALEEDQAQSRRLLETQLTEERARASDLGSKCASLANEVTVKTERLMAALEALSTCQLDADRRCDALQAQLRNALSSTEGASEEYANKLTQYEEQVSKSSSENLSMRTSLNEKTARVTELEDTLSKLQTSMATEKKKFENVVALLRSEKASAEEKLLSLTADKVSVEVESSEKLTKLLADKASTDMSNEQKVAKLMVDKAAIEAEYTQKVNKLTAEKMTLTESLEQQARNSQTTMSILAAEVDRERSRRQQLEADKLALIDDYELRISKLTVDQSIQSQVQQLLPGLENKMSRMFSDMIETEKAARLQVEEQQKVIVAEYENKLLKLEIEMKSTMKEKGTTVESAVIVSQPLADPITPSPGVGFTTPPPTRMSEPLPPTTEESGNSIVDTKLNKILAELEAERQARSCLEATLSSMTSGYENKLQSLMAATATGYERKLAHMEAELQTEARIRQELFEQLKFFSNKVDDKLASSIHGSRSGGGGSIVTAGDVPGISTSGSNRKQEPHPELVSPVRTLFRPDDAMSLVSRHAEIDDVESCLDAGSVALDKTNAEMARLVNELQAQPPATAAGTAADSRAHAVDEEADSKAASNEGLGSRGVGTQGPTDVILHKIVEGFKATKEAFESAQDKCVQMAKNVRDEVNGELYSAWVAIQNKSSPSPLQLSPRPSAIPSVVDLEINSNLRDSQAALALAQEKISALEFSAGKSIEQQQQQRESGAEKDDIETKGHASVQGSQASVPGRLLSVFESTKIALETAQHKVQNAALQLRSRVQEEAQKMWSMADRGAGTLPYASGGAPTGSKFLRNYIMHKRADAQKSVVSELEQNDFDDLGALNSAPKPHTAAIEADEDEPVAESAMKLAGGDWKAAIAILVDRIKGQMRLGRFLWTRLLFTEAYGLIPGKGDGDEVEDDRSLLCHIWVLDAMCCVEDAEFDRALTLYDEIFKCGTDLAVPSRPTVESDSELHLMALLGYGKLLHHTAKFNDSEASYMSGLKICDDLFEKGSVSGALEIIYLRLLTALSNLYLDIGAFEKCKIYLTISNAAPNPDTEAQSDGMVINARYEMACGAYKCAESLLEKALGAYSTLFGDSHPKIADSLLHKGVLLTAQCKFAAAVTTLEAAFHMRSRYCSKEHTAIATVLDAVGYVHLKTANYTSVYASFKSSMDVRVQLFGPSHPAVADSLWYIGEFNLAIGNLEEAERDLKSAMDMRASIFTSAFHDKNIASKLSIAKLYELKGSYRDALPVYETCLGLAHSSLSAMKVENHPLVEVTKISLAHVHCRLCRFEDARNLISKSGKVLCQLLGNHHAYVADGLHVLAIILMCTGKYEFAKKLFIAALDLYKTVFDSNHPVIANVLTNYSENFRLPGYFSDALEHSTSGLTKYLGVYSEGNILMIPAVLNKALLLRDMGQINEAEAMFEQVVQRTKPGAAVEGIGVAAEGAATRGAAAEGGAGDGGGYETGAMYALGLGELGECLRLRRLMDRSMATLVEALRIRKLVFGEHHISVAQAQLYIALLLIDMNDWSHCEQARQQLEEHVIPLVESIVGTNHPFFAYCRANLGLCLTTLQAFDVSAAHEPNSDVVGGTRGAEESIAHKLAQTARGQQMIDEALEFFDIYEQGPFGDDHPWIMRFGGWSAESARSARLGDGGSVAGSVADA